MVVITKGTLPPQRASMALPGIFSLAIYGKLLIDGGLRQIYLLVVKIFRLSVSAIDVTGKLVKKKSPLNDYVLGQTVIMTAKNVEEDLQYADAM